MRAEIKLIGQDGQNLEPFMRHPCVEVAVYPRPDNPIQVEGVRVWASVDTGADHIYIDPQIAELLHLPISGYCHVNGEPDQPIFDGSLSIVGIPGVAPVRFVQRRSRALGLPFDVVLGRILLNHLVLEYSPSEMIAQLRPVERQSEPG